MLMFGICILLPSAYAATDVRVLATHPDGASIALGRNQNFYLRIAYSTNEPVRIWARPYYLGQEVTAGTNPSPVYSDSGEALGWFFFMGDSEWVDEIRISAGDGSTAGTRHLATYPVSIRAGGGPVAAGVEPAWLATLRANNERLQREAYEQRMQEPASASDGAFAAGFMLGVLALGIGGIAAPLWAMRRWRGPWRIAAAMPALYFGFVILRILFNTAGDPTSHNLWPFELLYAGAISLAAIGALLVARRLVAVS